jgi:hypothetical protein
MATMWDASRVHEEVAVARVRKVEAGEAEGLLAAWERSGERLSDWCAARGLSWYSLSAYKGWRCRSPQVQLAELVVQAPARSAAYRVLVGDLAIEVDDDFRADTLRRLIQAVTAC